MVDISTPEDFDAWPELASLDAQLNGSVEDLHFYKHTLAAGKQRLVEQFNNGKSIKSIVRAKANLVDGILLRLWRTHAGTQHGVISLVAVGGYGRAELHPGSDIDVMLLLGKKRIKEEDKQGIESFLISLWDIGLEIGHSVRNLKECVNEAKNDITVATSLMESRLLHGDVEQFEKMRLKTGPDSIWPAQKFFEAKLEEQVKRHSRYDDTASNLEPNVKGSPGGLRDLQLVDWVAKRHFNTDTLRELVAKDFLSAHEYRSMSESRDFLWRLRFGLHTFAGRREDLLLFDYQAKLAEQFGYEDQPHSLGVEQLMQQYYRTATRVSRLNEMLLQLFSEAILTSKQSPASQINQEFQIINNNLDVINQDLFDRRPNALMRVFLHILEHPNITGVSARTIRLIRQKRELIDDRFRQAQENHDTFLRILRAPVGVTHELRRMNRYGILARYIPAFGKIVGLMQYDLFHAYTVDAHTLFVVSNLRRFSLTRFDHEFPYCSQIMQSLPKPELAYLAGLFHDIAKGRGGDHSELGATDAEQFCLAIGLGVYDARLVAWLVRNHLVLSVTAQKKDIDSPEVINEFSALVRDDAHLMYLYVLTVADVRGTNPKMWNSWKASLFESLYRQTKRALARGLENPIDREELIENTQAQAIKLLDNSGIQTQQRELAWQSFDETYFLRHSPSEIQWHTEVLCQHQKQHNAITAVRDLNNPGGGSLMVLAPRKADGFARVTAVLEQLGLTILDARITNVANDFSLDSYRIMSAQNIAHDVKERAQRIERAVVKSFKSAAAPKVTRTASRKVRVFSTPTIVDFAVDPESTQTIMEITAADQPGLLSSISQALISCEVRITAAKITTIGERAEDVFYLTDDDGNILDSSLCAELESEIAKRLENAA